MPFPDTVTTALSLLHCYSYISVHFLIYYLYGLECIFFITLLVTVEQVGDFGGCPGDPISLKCSVHSQRLAWKCPDGADRLVDCSNDPSDILPRTCQNETTVVYFLHHNCPMISDQTVIMSFVKFNASIYSLTCEDAEDASTTTNEIFTIPFEGGIK